MLRFRRPRSVIAIGCVALAACAGDDARSHVYQSPPPARAASPASPVSSTPEPPLGAAWPSAKINSVRMASTGTVASLGDITDSIDVLTVVSRGKGSSAAGPARIELHVAGPTDTTLTEVVDAPVPVAIARVFRLRVGPGPAVLRGGLYRMQLRLIGPSGREIARSTPLPLTVREQ